MATKSTNISKVKASGITSAAGFKQTPKAAAGINPANLAGAKLAQSPAFQAALAAKKAAGGGAPAATAPGVAEAQAKLVDPFSTPAEIQAAVQFLTGAAQQKVAIDQGLEEQRATAIQQLGVRNPDGSYQGGGAIDKAAVSGKNTANDSAAARGLGRSSIRDGALFDIEAQRVVNTNYLKDQIGRAETNATTNKGIIDNSVREYNKATVAQQAANAVGVNNQLQPETVTPPAAATTPTPAPIVAAAAAAKPVVAAVTSQPTTGVAGSLFTNVQKVYAPTLQKVGNVQNKAAADVRGFKPPKLPKAKVG